MKNLDFDVDVTWFNDKTICTIKKDDLSRRSLLNIHVKYKFNIATQC